MTFGKRFTTSGGNPARRDPTFQQRTYDEGLGIYDYRNRSFDPATGRFLQRDPVIGGDSLFNPYVFPGNNPVGNVDPMGLGEPRIRSPRRGDSPQAGEEAAKKMARELRGKLSKSEIENLKELKMILEKNQSKQKKAEEEAADEEARRSLRENRVLRRGRPRSIFDLLPSFGSGVRKAKEGIKKIMPKSKPVIPEQRLPIAGASASKYQSALQKLQSALSKLSIDKATSGLSEIQGLVQKSQELKRIADKVQTRGFKSLTKAERRILTGIVVTAVAVLTYSALAEDRPSTEDDATENSGRDISEKNAEEELTKRLGRKPTKKELQNFELEHGVSTRRNAARRAKARRLRRERVGGGATHTSGARNSTADKHAAGEKRKADDIKRATKRDY